MVFRQLLSRFGAKKRNEEFEIQLEHELTLGHILDVASDRSWYISLGQPFDELADGLGWVMRLYSVNGEMVCEARLAYDKRKRTILIGDIVSYIEDKGYCSIMLSRIVELARKLKIRELRGNLSSADSDHFDKLEYFYKKYGFEVKFNPGKVSGSIVKRLYKKRKSTQSV